jgi:DNA-binding HxlR family transcriptional regulator
MSKVFMVDCPARQALEAIMKKWAALILYQLTERPHRFGELLKSVDGLSQKVLTATLRDLQRNGLIARTVDATTVPIAVTYSLTPLGVSLSDPLRAIRVWAEQHGDAANQARASYDHDLLS